MKKFLPILEFLPLLVLLCGFTQAAGGLKIPFALIPETVSEISPGVLYAPTTDFAAPVIRPAGEIPARNVWMKFGKTFTLDSVPEKALARIAADSRYWLTINGKLVVWEGGLKRGPAPNAMYYDEIDLKPFLKAGENRITALVWFWGKDGFSHINSGQPGFMFDATTNGEKGLFLKSDATWKAWVEKAYVPETADPQPNFRLPESNVRADSRLMVKSSETEKPAAVEVAEPAEKLWGGLYKRPFKGWKFDAAPRKFESLKTVENADGTKTVIGRLPYNMHESPWLRVNAKAGEEISIQTDGYHVGDPVNGEPSLRFEYVCKDGEQDFQFPEWFSGNQVEYTMPASVEVLDLGYVESGFPAEFTGTFECSDEFYVRLYKKAARTLYVTMRDTYMDCPDRERALWWGDAVNELGEAFYALDREADQLTKKGIYELMRFQKPDGVIYAPIPAGNWDKELPAQMLATQSTYGLGTYALYSGDWATVLDVYPRTLRYLAVWDWDADGLVAVRHGGWSWADWGVNIDLRLILNAWYSLALEQAIQTGEMVRDLKNGKGDAALQELVKKNPSLVALDAEAVLNVLYAQRDSLKQNFNRVFWTGTCYRSPEYKGETDDRSNAMAFLAGFAEPEKYAALREVMKKEEHASPYMEKYVLEALFRMGYDVDALERMKVRYSEMINNDSFTTLWEGWGHHGIERGTFNHAWSGGGLTCLAQFSAGIEPTSPAFRTFRVRPQMGNLTRVATSLVTKSGTISVDLTKNEAGKITLKLTVPAGTTAEVAGKSYVAGTHEIVIP